MAHLKSPFDMQMGVFDFVDDDPVSDGSQKMGKKGQYISHYMTFQNQVMNRMKMKYPFLPLPQIKSKIREQWKKQNHYPANKQPRAAKSKKEPKTKVVKAKYVRKSVSFAEPLSTHVEAIIDYGDDYEPRRLSTPSKKGRMASTPKEAAKNRLFGDNKTDETPVKLTPTRVTPPQEVRRARRSSQNANRLQLDLTGLMDPAPSDGDDIEVPRKKSPAVRNERIASTPDAVKKKLVLDDKCDERPVKRSSKRVTLESGMESANDASFQRDFSSFMGLEVSPPPTPVSKVFKSSARKKNFKGSTLTIAIRMPFGKRPWFKKNLSAAGSDVSVARTAVTASPERLKETPLTSQEQRTPAKVTGRRVSRKELVYPEGEDSSAIVGNNSSRMIRSRGDIEDSGFNSSDNYDDRSDGDEEENQTTGSKVGQSIFDEETDIDSSLEKELPNGKKKASIKHTKVSVFAVNGRRHY